VEAIKRRTAEGDEVEMLLNHSGKARRVFGAGRVLGTRLGPWEAKVRPTSS
jgi:hypothetical protein